MPMLKMIVGGGGELSRHAKVDFKVEGGGEGEEHALSVGL